MRCTACGPLREKYTEVEVSSDKHQCFFRACVAIQERLYDAQAFSDHDVLALRSRMVEHLQGNPAFKTMADEPHEKKNKTVLEALKEHKLATDNYGSASLISPLVAIVGRPVVLLDVNRDGSFYSAELFEDDAVIRPASVYARRDRSPGGDSSSVFYVRRLHCVTQIVDLPLADCAGIILKKGEDWHFCALVPKRQSRLPLSRGSSAIEI